MRLELNKTAGKIIDIVQSKISLKTVVLFIMLFGIIFFIFTMVLHVSNLESNFWHSEYFDWDVFTSKSGEFLVEYFEDWGGILGIFATFLLAFAAFWVISDTRRFRYVDERKVLIDKIGIWLTDTLNEISLPSIWSSEPDVFKKDISTCRMKLAVKYSECFMLFSKVRESILNDEEFTKECRTTLSSAMIEAQKGLQLLINELGKINVPTISDKTDFKPLLNKLGNVSSSLARLTRAISNISLELSR